MRKTNKTILIIIFIIIFILSIVILFINSDKDKDYINAKAEMRVTAAEIYSAYIKDEAYASKQFTDKFINIEGIIDTVEFVHKQRVVVMFVDEGKFGFEGIRAELDDTETETLEVGDNIILKGFCTGFKKNNVLIKHSLIIEKAN